MTSEEAMRLALDEAANAPLHGDLPIGAVVIADDRVLARRHEEVVLRRDPTAHTTLLALADAAALLKGWRLLDCLLVVTLEPCAMCVGAALSARIPRLLLGAADVQAGAAGSRVDLTSDSRLNHEIAVDYAPPFAELQAYATAVERGVNGERS